MNKPTLFIGIPAFNEGGNIGYLLKSLFKQASENYELDKIFVVSDGSTDNTVEICESFNNQNLKISDDKQRKGVAARQNEILAECNADILVLLNGDIDLENDRFLDALSEAIINGADMVAARMGTVTPTNFVESVISKSEEMKRAMFEEFKSGFNVYTCHGAARAFSKKFYKSFKFETAVGEDAYTYFYTLNNKLSYAYAKEAIFYIRAAGSPKDYFKQSNRHINTVKKMKRLFTKIDITKEYRMPMSIKLKFLVIYFVKSPVKISAFVLLFLGGFIKSFFTKPKEAWDMSSSTKVLYENRAN